MLALLGMSLRHGCISWWKGGPSGLWEEDREFDAMGHGRGESYSYISRSA